MPDFQGSWQNMNAWFCHLTLKTDPWIITRVLCVLKTLSNSEKMSNQRGRSDFSSIRENAENKHCHSMQRLQMTIKVMVHIPMMKSVMRMTQWQTASPVKENSKREFRRAWTPKNGRTCKEALQTMEVALMLQIWMENQRAKASTQRVGGKVPLSFPTMPVRLMLSGHLVVMRLWHTMVCDSCSRTSWWAPIPYSTMPLGP